jgi:hypothetical protein
VNDFLCRAASFVIAHDHRYAHPPATPHNSFGLRSTLHLERSRHDRRLVALAPALPPLALVLLIVGGDDLLARISMIHLALEMRKEIVEAVVEDACGEEGVDVANGEPGKKWL